MLSTEYQGVHVPLGGSGIEDVHWIGASGFVMRGMKASLVWSGVGSVRNRH